jgi:type IV pilus assembly protein PilW
MKTYKTHQKGLTLVELLVAMAISVTLLGGLIEVYLGSKQSYTLAEESSRLQENGRFAIDIMTREIRTADFWGCLRSSDDLPLQNGLDTASGNYDPSQHEFGDAITGVDGGGSAPDSISFGGAYGSGISITQKSVQTSAQLHVNTDNGLDVNDIVILSDCTQGDIFQITNANPNDSGQVVHNTGNVSAGPGNKSTVDCTGNNAHCLSKIYDTDAQIYEMRRIGYDIRPSTTTDSGANGLFRTEGGVSSEVIENVENMQILYGEDTDADNAANQYVNATDIGANIGNAISVRVALLLKGEKDILPQNTAQNHQLLDAVVATNDRRLYRVFTTTITIRNRALN